MWLTEKTAPGDTSPMYKDMYPPSGRAHASVSVLMQFCVTRKVLQTHLLFIITGKYSLAGASSCDACPVGQYCENGDSAPQDCGPGYYSPAGGECFYWVELTLIFINDTAFPWSCACILIVYFECKPINAHQWRSTSISDNSMNRLHCLIFLGISEVDNVVFTW